MGRCRSRLVRDLAGKSAGVRGEIDEADGFAFAGRYRHGPAQVFVEAVSDRDGTLRRSGGKDRAGESLGDGADAENCLAVRDDIGRRGNPAEA